MHTFFSQCYPLPPNFKNVSQRLLKKAPFLTSQGLLSGQSFIKTGTMHPLLELNGCKCTRFTCASLPGDSNWKEKVTHSGFFNYHQLRGSTWTRGWREGGIQMSTLLHKSYEVKLSMLGGEWVKNEQNFVHTVMIRRPQVKF